MNATELKIRIYGDPALRKKSSPVKRLTQSHRDVMSSMARLMYENQGIGLAAPQVGINEMMIVADIGNALYKLVNPKVIKKEGEQIIEEGCLSVPGICINVKRAGKISVEALDEDGKPLKIETEGLLACVLQHEIDHLKGRLIVDYASFLDKIKIKRKLAQLKGKFKDEKLSQSETKSCKLQL